MTARDRLANLTPPEAEEYRRRFASRTGKPTETGCFPWTGSLRTTGYGRMSVKGGYVSAHRIAWCLRHGKSPGDKLVCHRCDNRWCVNADHLWLGTVADNTKDMVRKGRAVEGQVASASHRGEGHSRAKLTDAAVLEIRKARARGLALQPFSARYGVSAAAVYAAATRHTWAHLPG